MKTQGKENLNDYQKELLDEALEEIIDVWDYSNYLDYLDGVAQKLIWNSSRLGHGEDDGRGDIKSLIQTDGKLDRVKILHLVLDLGADMTTQFGSYSLGAGFTDDVREVDEVLGIIFSKDPRSEKEKFLHAVYRGDLEFIRDNPNEEFNEAALHLAMISGKVEIFEHLYRPEYEKGLIQARNKAAKLGRTDVLKSFLEKVELKQDEQDEEAKFKEQRIKDYLMMSAACKGHAETVEMLLGKGAQVDYFEQGHPGKTSLSYVIKSIKLDPLKARQTVEVLLNHGAKMQGLYSNRDTKSAFFIAAQYSHSEILELFLDRGVDINTIDENGRTALFHASDSFLNNILGKDGPKATKMLIDRGADIYVKDNKGQTALFNANHKGTELILDKNRENSFDQEPYVKIKDNENRTAVDQGISSFFSGSERLKVLLDEGYDVGVKELTDVIKSGNKEKVELILSKVLESCSSQDERKEFLGNLKMNDEIRRAFLSSLTKQDNERDKNRGVNYEETALYLLEKGIIDIEARDGESLLYFYAAVGNKSKIVKFFLDKGVNSDIPDPLRNETALTVAASDGCVETIEVLLSKGVGDSDQSRDNWNNALREASLHNKVGSVQALLRANPNSVVNHKDALNRAFKIASRFKKTGAMKALLDGGFDINSELELDENDDPERNTAFRMACRHADTKYVMDFLLENGVDLDKEREYEINFVVENVNIKTATMLAVTHSEAIRDRLIKKFDDKFKPDEALTQWNRPLSKNKIEKLRELNGLIIKGLAPDPSNEKAVKNAKKVANLVIRDFSFYESRTKEVSNYFLGVVENLDSGISDSLNSTIPAALEFPGLTGKQNAAVYPALFEVFVPEKTRQIIEDRDSRRRAPYLVAENVVDEVVKEEIEDFISQLIVDDLNESKLKEESSFLETKESKYAERIRGAIQENTQKEEEKESNSMVGKLRGAVQECSDQTVEEDEVSNETKGETKGETKEQPSPRTKLRLEKKLRQSKPLVSNSDLETNSNIARK